MKDLLFMKLIYEIYLFQLLFEHKAHTLKTHYFQQAVSFHAVCTSLLALQIRHLLTLYSL